MQRNSKKCVGYSMAQVTNTNEYDNEANIGVVWFNELICVAS